jgi:acyl-CoA synthetase (AMP-forming)/AMP-acid ligase II
MATKMAAQALTDPTHIDTTLWDALERNVTQRPDHPALITLYEPAEHLSQLLPPTLRHNGTSKTFSWTYAQLAAGVETVARHFVHLGLQTGDRLAVFMTSSVENLVCMLACMRIGVTWATSNPAFAEDAQHASHILNTIKPRGVLVSSSKQASSLSRYIPTAGSDERPTFLFLCGSEDSPQNAQWTTLKDIMQAPVPTSEAFDHAVSTAKEKRPLPLIMFTSGTTNLPKACPISPRMANHVLHYGSEYFGIHQQTRQLVSGPLFHGLGIWLSLMALYKAGTVCIATKRFDPATCLHTLETLGCTGLALAPSMVYSVTAQPSFVAGTYCQIETFMLGADYISKDVVELVKTSFQPRIVLNAWGMTEGMLCLMPHHSDPILWHDDLCFSGYVVPGSNIRICDPETGHVLSSGETGEFQMSGPSVIEGYLADGDKIFQNEAFCTDGSRTWFKSGDAALMREGGEVFISGRYKDMIIRGGENMSPGYIENCIDGIEGVKVRNHF